MMEGNTDDLKGEILVKVFNAVVWIQKQNLSMHGFFCLISRKIYLIVSKRLFIIIK